MYWGLRNHVTLKKTPLCWSCRRQSKFEQSKWCWRRSPGFSRWPILRPEFRLRVLLRGCFRRVQNSIEGSHRKIPKFYWGIISEESKILSMDRIRRVQNSTEGSYQKSPKFFSGIVSEESNILRRDRTRRLQNWSVCAVEKYLHKKHLFGLLEWSVSSNAYASDSN